MNIQLQWDIISVKNTHPKMNIIKPKLGKGLPGQHCQSLGRFSDPQRVLIQHINRWHKKTSPGDVVRVKVTVRNGTEQVIVFTRQSSITNGNSQFVNKLLQRINVDLQMQQQDSQQHCKMTQCLKLTLPDEVMGMHLLP